VVGVGMGVECVIDLEYSCIHEIDLKGLGKGFLGQGSQWVWNFWGFFVEEREKGERKLGLSVILSRA
jgi:hypothetical protein